jgi:hypothetical protein
MEDDHRMGWVDHLPAAQIGLIDRFRDLPHLCRDVRRNRPLAGKAIV